MGAESPRKSIIKSGSPKFFATRCQPGLSKVYGCVEKLRSKVRSLTRLRLLGLPAASVERWGPRMSSRTHRTQAAWFGSETSLSKIVLTAASRIGLPAPRVDNSEERREQVPQEQSVDIDPPEAIGSMSVKVRAVVLIPRNRHPVLGNWDHRAHPLHSLGVEPR